MHCIQAEPAAFASLSRKSAGAHRRSGLYVFIIWRPNARAILRTLTGHKQDIIDREAKKSRISQIATNFQEETQDGHGKLALIIDEQPRILPHDKSATVRS
jgi:hypothetical protein